MNTLHSTKKYQLIYADPPWTYADTKGNDPKMGGITYPTISLQNIKNLPVVDIAHKDCALALWATMPLLKEAIEVIEAWGFKYTTCLFNWVKLNPSVKDCFCFTLNDIYSGLGHWVNGNAELVLYGKKGHPKRYEKNVKQIQLWARGRHSAKPPQIRDEIIKVFGDLPRIELFAREKTEGWDVWGNEVESDIIL